MFQRGHYQLRCIYWHGEKELIVVDVTKSHNYHTHVPYNKFKAAQMITIRANDGKIPERYPRWMVVSINRLWYGKDTKKMDLIKEEQEEVKHHKQRYKNKVRGKHK